jgi:hypothetical protein
MTEIMIRDVAGFVAAFKRRIRELSITFETVDHLSGLPSGYTAKVMCGMKRPGPIAIQALCAALAIGFVPVVDEEQAARVKDRWTARKRPLFGEDASS